jgi:hypothetical protein
MAGHAAARALTRPRAARTAGRFDVSVAAADDAEVRRVLRESPLGGSIMVSLEREPDSGIAAAIEGDVHHTLIARERSTGRVAAIGSRSVRNVYINGRRSRLAYLGQLRFARPFRVPRELLESGFAACRALHESGDAPFSMISIVADNEPAARLLLGMRSTSMPRFVPAGAVSTLVMQCRGRARQKARQSVEIRSGTPELLGDILACLRRHAVRHQFAPDWGGGVLCSPLRTPDLTPANFVVAIRAGRVVGCVALWDQRRFKQVVVRGYSPNMARVRPLLNAGGRWLGIPRLPDPGQRLDFAYLSHLAVDEDAAETAACLVAAARQRAAPDLDYVVTGIGEGSPLLAPLRRAFRHREYRSLLFLACWPGEEAAAHAVDGRVPHPEVAIL